MARFYHATNQSRDTHAIRPHLHGNFGAITRYHNGIERFGIFIAKQENMADLNPSCGNSFILRHLCFETLRVMHVVRRRVSSRPLVDKTLNLFR